MYNALPEVSMLSWREVCTSMLSSCNHGIVSEYLNHICNVTFRLQLLSTGHDYNPYRSLGLALWHISWVASTYEPCQPSRICNHQICIFLLQIESSQPLGWHCGLEAYNSFFNLSNPNFYFSTTSSRGPLSSHHKSFTSKAQRAACSHKLPSTSSIPSYHQKPSSMRPYR